MTNDLRVVSVFATIVEYPDTTPMIVRIPTRKVKIHQKGGVEEMNLLIRIEGVEMIVMNEALSEKKGFGEEGQVI